MPCQFSLLDHHSWMDDVVRFSCQNVVSFFSLSGHRPECNSVSFTKKEMGSVFRFYTFSYKYDNLPAIWVGSYCVCFYLTQIPSLFFKKKKEEEGFSSRAFFLSYLSLIHLLLSCLQPLVECHNGIFVIIMHMKIHLQIGNLLIYSWL